MYCWQKRCFSISAPLLRWSPSILNSHGIPYRWVLLLAVGKYSFHSAVTVPISVSVLYYFAMLRSRLFKIRTTFWTMNEFFPPASKVSFVPLLDGSEITLGRPADGFKGHLNLQGFWSHCLLFASPVFWCSRMVA